MKHSKLQAKRATEKDLLRVSTKGIRESLTLAFQSAEATPKNDMIRTGYWNIDDTDC